MARLAADLKDFIDALQLEKPVVVGTSLGCAVIWAYVELYAAAHAAKKHVFAEPAHAAAPASSPFEARDPAIAAEHAGSRQRGRSVQYRRCARPERGR